MEVILLLPFIIAVVLTALGSLLGSTEGEALLILARLVPVQVMATFALLHPPPFRPRIRWSDYAQFSVSVSMAATSLMLSGVGLAFLKVDMTYVFGLVFLVLARLVSIAGLLYWQHCILSLSREPRLTASSFLVRWIGDSCRTLSSTLLSVLRRKPLRIAMVMFGVALACWRAHLCWLTFLYSALVVVQTALQWQCLRRAPYRGTAWGVLSGLLLVLAHLPVLLAGSQPLSEWWTVALYYLAMTAYTLSAVYSLPG